MTIISDQIITDQNKYKSKSLCDYNDAYILFKSTIIITGVGTDAAARQADEIKKTVNI